MTFDPGISEWGNPPCRDARYPLMWGHTRGTETSKYPQEEKITNDSPSSGERTGRSPNRTPLEASGLGSFPFARRYLGNHSYFLFLRVLRCFSSPRLPPHRG